MLTRKAWSAHGPHTPTEPVRGRVRAYVFVCHMRAYDNSLSCWVFHLGCEEGAKKTTVVIKPCLLLYRPGTEANSSNMAIQRTIQGRNTFSWGFAFISTPVFTVDIYVGHDGKERHLWDVAKKTKKSQVPHMRALGKLVATHKWPRR